MNGHYAPRKGSENEDANSTSGPKLYIFYADNATRGHMQETVREVKSAAAKKLRRRARSRPMAKPKSGNHYTG